ncbi:hypothetical protein F0562_029057 [Nyssa sinensis]|uniref:Uncharacterized protein n=1 Tax=Nyssa sinensis TaxID=561372 RepID=A0A5J5B1K8_9ASTE|nr:hypothetical protein F0562_029057 [Nyssa sinensis]
MSLTSRTTASRQTSDIADTATSSAAVNGHEDGSEIPKTPLSKKMSLRSRTTASRQKSRSDTADTATTLTAVNDRPEIPRNQLSKRPSFSQRAISQTLTTTANLANLLPTGTLLAFQLLTPIFTNNGSCDAATRPMTFCLLALLAVSCFLGSFTDSFKSSDGRVYYGLATFRGMWLFDFQAASGQPLPDLSKYRLSFIDWVHAVLSVFVFAAVALRDKNVQNCFYPMPAHTTQEPVAIINPPTDIQKVAGCICLVGHFQGAVA